MTAGCAFLFCMVRGFVFVHVDHEHHTTWDHCRDHPAFPLPQYLIHPCWGCSLEGKRKTFTLSMLVTQVINSMVPGCFCSCLFCGNWFGFWPALTSDKFPFLTLCDAGHETVCCCIGNRTTWHNVVGLPAVLFGALWIALQILTEKMMWLSMQKPKCQTNFTAISLWVVPIVWFCQKCCIIQNTKLNIPCFVDKVTLIAAKKLDLQVSTFQTNGDFALFKLKKLFARQMWWIGNT